MNWIERTHLRWNRSRNEAIQDEVPCHLQPPRSWSARVKVPSALIGAVLAEAGTYARTN
jgi:hypothetical protein